MSLRNGSKERKRRALVLSGGGSRGAYEAGVLAWMFENVYPKLGEHFEFDIISGTSVGAIHGAYVACTAGLPPAQRAKGIVDTWKQMRFDNVLQVSWKDFLGIPLRGLGFGRPRKRGESDAPESMGGLVDIAPLEKLVHTRIPWDRLRANLAARRPGVLCNAVTEVSSGIVRVFLDGPDADTTPWSYDPNVDAVATKITQLHVRASAAIPFLFPAVRIDDRYYVDGGLRLNTPLSPAIRLAAEKVLVVGLKKRQTKAEKTQVCDAQSLTKPAFLLGKLLDVILLDPIDNELRQLEIINAMIAGGKRTFGEDFVEKLEPTLQKVRGIGYKPVDFFMQSPSEDIGRIAADCYHRGDGNSASRGAIATLIKQAATFGVPENEADFLSYIYFDNAFTNTLVDLGREDARSAADEIFALLEPEVPS